MSTAIFVGDIVEGNGKTIKQNNMELKHYIPLGALVEISYYAPPEDPDNTNGLRLFVVDHTRDCDGTPLYSLSFSRDAKKKLDEIAESLQEPQSDENFRLGMLLKWNAQGAILNGYSEESLTVIE